MSVTPDTGPTALATPQMIAGHTFALQDRAGGVLTLRIALRGVPLVALARSLANLDGVRVTGGPEGTGPARCYLVHCLGFKMVLSSDASAEDTADFALALVSRAPQAALAIVSDLGRLLDRLMSEPQRLSAPAPADRHGSRSATGDPPAAMKRSSALRRSAFQQGKPLARKTELRRKTPLARGPFRKF
jgi:hypothetical protein